LNWELHQALLRESLREKVQMDLALEDRAERGGGPREMKILRM